MQEDELKKYIASGHSTRNIAEATGNSQTNVRHWLKKFGLKTNRKIGNEKDRRCGMCGDTDPKKFYGKMKYRCGPCHNKDTTRRFQEKRKKILDYLGGSCVHCGFNKWACSLEVHHTDPSKKDPNFGTHRGWKWERIKEELQGCVILCGQCHPAVHAGFITLDPFFP